MNQLRKYIRDKNHKPIGIVIAEKIGGEIHWGWSLCNFKKGDRFNREHGIKIAEGRILHGTNAEMPIAVRECMNLFIPRARKYFKV
jgi:hypothetical protein